MKVYQIFHQVDYEARYPVAVLDSLEKAIKHAKQYILDYEEEDEIDFEDTMEIFESHIGERFSPEKQLVWEQHGK